MTLREQISKQHCFCFTCADNTNYYVGEDAVECMDCNSGNIRTEEEIICKIRKVTCHKANKDHNKTVKAGDYYQRVFYRVKYRDGKKEVVLWDSIKTKISKEYFEKMKLKEDQS